MIPPANPARCPRCTAIGESERHCRRCGLLLPWAAPARKTLSPGEFDRRIFADPTFLGENGWELPRQAKKRLREALKGVEL